MFGRGLGLRRQQGRGEWEEYWTSRKNAGLENARMGGWLSGPLDGCREEAGLMGGDVSGVGGLVLSEEDTGRNGMA